MDRRNIQWILALILTGVVLIWFGSRPARQPEVVPPAETARVYTVESRLAEIGASARGRMEPYFVEAGVVYPGAFIVLLGLKEERRLEVYAGRSPETLRFIRSYSVQGASGTRGPKLREGDLQVPEGIYPIESLNPNSRFHVSLRVGYPNLFDRAMAKAEGRTNLGGDIMIHGSNVSIGCLAMGDDVAEELFVLAADVGVGKMKVVIAPFDFRKRGKPAPSKLDPPWLAGLYRSIDRELGLLQPGP